MDTIKNIGKAATTSSSPYAPGYKVPISSQDGAPGQQSQMPVQAINDQLPTYDGGMKPYLACGKLTGRKTLITGGDSGIGRAVAILFAMEGAESTIVYTPEEENDAQETKRLVQEKGGILHLAKADLKLKEQCRQVVENARQLMGTINILVLNHGTQMVQEKIDTLSEEQWENTFAVNIHPFFYISKYVLPHMTRGDTIITCASINHYIGRPDLLDYSATKGAIVAFTRALSNQQLERGIRVNTVCPGPIWTPLIPATMPSSAQDQFTSPMGRPGQPAEVATCFVFLASQDSSFISGQALHPNGGTITGS